tara:strand:- start:709 stop:1089 length:381 start_codon:yes stop_codon:yes gene_type:complete
MIVKIENFHGLKKLLQITLIFLFLFNCPVNTYSAELLRINDVNTILVGDQNRSLNLSLYCIDINENEKEKATEILKRNFPRGTKVKIKPYGSNGNRLLAKIFRVDDETEMTQLLNTYNTSENNCNN